MVSIISFYALKSTDKGPFRKGIRSSVITLVLNHENVSNFDCKTGNRTCHIFRMWWCSNGTYILTKQFYLLVNLAPLKIYLLFWTLNVKKLIYIFVTQQKCLTTVLNYVHVARDYFRKLFLLGTVESWKREPKIKVLLCLKSP